MFSKSTDDIVKSLIKIINKLEDLEESKISDISQRESEIVYLKAENHEDELEVSRARKIRNNLANILGIG